MNSIAASAEEWGISPRVAWIIALLPIVGAAAVFMTYFSRPLYRFVTKEDGPVEWAQILCYTGAVSPARLLHSSASRPAILGKRCCSPALHLVNFFIVGEEIAWAQRIFGLRDAG